LKQAALPWRGEDSALPWLDDEGAVIALLQSGIVVLAEKEEEVGCGSSL
jgi:hypothetical protein